MVPQTPIQELSAPSHPVLRETHLPLLANAPLLQKQAIDCELHLKHLDLDPVASGCVERKHVVLEAVCYVV
jgi:hypothetical protein